MTDPNARIVRPGYDVHAPRTPAEFAQHFDKSELAQLNRDDMEFYRTDVVANPERALAYKSSSVAQHAKTALPKSSFITSIPMQTRALMVRRFQIIGGGILAQVIQTTCVYALPSTFFDADSPQSIRTSGYNHGYHLP